MPWTDGAARKNAVKPVLSRAVPSNFLCRKVFGALILSRILLRFLWKSEKWGQRHPGDALLNVLIRY